MTLAELIAQAKTLLGSTAPTGGEKHSVLHDRWDHQTYDELLAEVPTLANNVDAVARDFDYVPPAYEDLFNLLYQGSPLLVEQAAMDERYRPNRKLVSELEEAQALDRLRTSTTHDQYASALAMLSMQDKIESGFAAIKQAQEAAEEARQRAQEARQRLQDLVQQAESLPSPQGGENGQESPEGSTPGAESQTGNGASEPGNAGGSSTNVDDEQMAQAIQQAMAVTEQASNAAQSATAQADERAAEQAPELAQAADAAAAEREEEDALMRSFGVEDGELQKMSFAERRALAERLSRNRLAAFAKLLGQFRMRAAGEQRRRVTHRHEEIVGIEMGNDIERVLPTELTDMVTPELEEAFWLRFTSGELLQYEMRGTEVMGQGPVIVVCDESGSMNSDLGGATCEAWSKALALGLCDNARRDRRDFTYIGFSSARQVWELDFRDGVAPIGKVIEFTEHFFGGGTAYEPALALALTLVEEADAVGKPKPDVVMITDDAYTDGLNADFMTRWEEVKERTSMRCFGILLDDSGRTSGALAKVSDSVRTLSDLNEATEAADQLFRTI